jgi:hypothetical protein
LGIVSPATDIAASGSQQSYRHTYAIAHGRSAAIGDADSDATSDRYPGAGVTNTNADYNAAFLGASWGVPYGFYECRPSCR